MNLSSVDTKLLWGRAGGICSAPGCGADLTAIVEKGAYVIGEMAHVIGRKPTARRAVPEGGADTYDNLILLCPTHHKHVDKAPEGTYSTDLLHVWKKQHEEKVRAAGTNQQFKNAEELHREIARLLAANKALHDTFGPRSEIAMRDPVSNAFSVWDLRRLDRILPTNRKILNLLDVNRQLLSNTEVELAERFRVHAEAYERHVYDRLDNYPLFPQEFARIFSIK
jgi:hypothetical protein